MNGEDVLSQNGIQVGYKGVKAAVSGPLGVLAAVFLLVGGGAVYVNYRGFEDVKALLQRSAADHDLLSCVVSLSVEERQELRRVDRRADFVRFCPWLRQ